MRPVIAEEDSEFEKWLLTEYRPIGGGDINAEDEGSGSEDPEGSQAEGAEGQGSEGEGAQGQGSEGENATDEKGVPLRNRLAEERRKREKAEREAAEAKAVAASLERSLGSTRTEPDSQEEDEDTLLLTNPKAYREKLKSEVLQEVGKVRQEAQMKEFLEEFPELKNKDSEDFQAVNEKYQELVSTMGVNNIGVLRTAAEIIYARKPKKKEDTRLAEPVGNGGAVSSQRGRRVEITPQRREVMRKLGITDEKRIAEIYSRDYSEEIRTGG